MKKNNKTQIAFAILAVLVIVAMVGGVVVSVFVPQPNQTAMPAQSSSQAISAEDQQKIKDLQQFLQGSPQDKNALLDLGSVYLRTGQYQPAADTFKKVVDLDPGNADALTQLGISNLALGSLNPAVDQLKKAVAANPNQIQAHYYLGVALASGSAPDKAGAIAEFQSVKKLDTSGQYSKAADQAIQQLQK